MDFYLKKIPYRPNQWWDTGDPYLFSDADYKEPGYLVVGGQVWFQARKGQQTLVGPIAPAGG